MVHLCSNNPLKDKTQATKVKKSITITTNPKIKNHNKKQLKYK